MAGLRVAAENTANVALSAATAKTVIQINLPAQQRGKIARIGVGFDGASTTAVPGDVQLVRKTTAGTGTALTLTKLVSSDTETIQTTATENHSAEGTGTTDIIDQWKVHPQQGLDCIYPWGQERIIAGGGRLALVCNFPAVVNVRAKIEFEE